MLTTIKSLDVLNDQQRYLQQITRVYQKARSQGLAQVFLQQQANVPLINFYFDSNRLSKALATGIKNETYWFKTQFQFQKKVGIKTRTLYRPSLVDKIVAGVVANVLTEIFEPYLSPNCFSYRKGLGPESAIRALSIYLKKTDPRQGIYFIKTDISAYTDSIPVYDRSELFNIMDTIYEKLEVAPTPYQKNVVKQIIRPVIINAEGNPQCNLYGLPMGNPITTCIANIYMSEVDKEIEKIPDIFYVRFCDDIFIAHPDYKVLTKAISALDITINKLRLKRNVIKDKVAYLSLSGFKQVHYNLPGTHAINYLGFRILANGLYSVSKKRQKSFLSAFKKRIKNLKKISESASVNELGITLCEALNKALVEDHVSDSRVVPLLKQTTDDKQLKHLDYLLALEIAEALSGVRGVRAFRYISYRRIRQDWGLHSLLRLRKQYNFDDQ